MAGFFEALLRAAPNLSGFTKGGSLDPEILQYFANNPAFSQLGQMGQPARAGGYEIRPEFQYDGQGDDNKPTTMTGFSAYGGGPKYSQYDPSGAYQGENDVSHHSLMEKIAPLIPILASGGAAAGAFGGGGLFGGAGTGVVGDATQSSLMWPGMGGGTAGGEALAGSAGVGGGVAGLPGGAEADLMYGGGANSVPSVFNPAVDSQIASGQLGITGTQAGLDAAEGAIPSVAGSGGGGWLTQLASQLGIEPDTLTSLMKMGVPLTQIFSGLQGQSAAGKLQGQNALGSPFTNPGMFTGAANATAPAGAGASPFPGPFTPPDPSDVTKIPGYQAGLEAVQRSMAAQGYQGSGNMMAALAKYGTEAYDKDYAQKLQGFGANLTGNQQGFAQRSTAYGQGLQTGQLQLNSVNPGPTYAGMSSLALLSQGAQGLAGILK